MPHFVEENPMISLVGHAWHRRCSARRAMRRGLVLGVFGVVFAGCPEPGPPMAPCGLDEATWRKAEAASVARVFDEVALQAVRRDLPAPTVHSRNLFHTSAAMYDAWAAYDAHARGLFFTEKLAATDVDAARREAVSYAAYRLLWHRYRQTPGGGEVAGCLDEAMTRLGYEPGRTDTRGDEPYAVGNRIAAQLIASTLTDGANEDGGYTDTTGFVAQNPPLQVGQEGTVMNHPEFWQPLEFEQAFTQNGISQGSGVQPYMGAHWRNVTPFAMRRAGGALYHDPGAAPVPADAQMKAWMNEVIRKQSKLDPRNTDTIDISPGAYGNNSVGANDGHGHAMNPATGQPYAPNVVPVADFGRVMAEFWADGPQSETPPGHWNVIANAVSDSPQLVRKLGGQGAELPRLEWDVKVYLALNGALHDAAITAWEVKRAFTTARPISLIRYAGALGQSSDASGLSYSPGGLALEDDLVEVVTPDSVNGRHAGFSVGEVVVKAWEQTERDPSTGAGGVHWKRVGAWMPYQRTTFVTPAFPGFISGHSTFSRAGAEVLADLTGSEFFPGGLMEYVVPRNAGLQFELGPTVDVHLQWATYFDAADQAGQSRLWGGIHIEPDDFVGRRLGQQVGRDAVAKARGLFAGP